MSFVRPTCWACHHVCMPFSCLSTLLSFVNTDLQLWFLISLTPFLNLDPHLDDSYLHKQILGHVPDMVVDQDPDSPIPQVMETYGVLLFADISGIRFLLVNKCVFTECSCLCVPWRRCSLQLLLIVLHTLRLHCTVWKVLQQCRQEIHRHWPVDHHTQLVPQQDCWRCVMSLSQHRSPALQRHATHLHLQPS